MTSLPGKKLTLAYSGNPLDRDDRLRIQPDILEKAADGRVMLFIGDRVMTDQEGYPLWYHLRDLPGGTDLPRVFLGRDRSDDTLIYGVRAPYTDTAWQDFVANLPDTGEKPRDVRGLAMKLAAGDPALGMVAQAKSLLDWHETHGFCARCGHATEIAKGGYMRQCTSCGGEHYPRTDPVVIMLPVYGEGRDAKTLLGRQPKFPAGMYSALAGFVEPGETLEEAVQRELLEEAGVTAYDVRYIASQPWPWPSSLMIGCLAKTDSLDVEPDMDEIDGLEWMDRQAMQSALDGSHKSIFLPPPLAIAHQLVLHWLWETGDSA